ncbi:interferon-related developmental regulator-domain-containing protein [Boeremia exigua]|uniref:interferon-related developmental regulator-domain-containing protein n=1 Tax=Boeremia exigua TaxID=749465 RepID=UPI001E8D6C97|nr:interferon-related developmental regulator-domain-containing protein [Boeremia exigua]KAH6621962.1 interferon-related developmental regulator-domain-containing protein [Boeremia exigua]
MRDLRKQALESHKTMSRKARSKIASGNSSVAGSRTASRNVSRAPSDEGDDGYLSDETAWSTNSLDDILNGEDVNISEEQWKSELNVRIEQITNLKRSTTEGRTASFAAYAYIIMARFANEEIEPQIRELLQSMLRSIRQETTPSETIKALKALAATIVTLDTGDVYEDVSGELKRAIQSESGEVQANAIHCLGVAAFFGGAGEDEIKDIMTLFLGIVESDGASVDAPDNGSVVTAALESWGLLATDIDDLQEETEAAIEAFVDQLESSDAGVQIAAGENIALLYEKSYTAQEEDEEIEPEWVNEDHPEFVKGASKLVNRYQVYRNQSKLLQTLDDLATVSSRRISKKDRRTLHSTFTDIRNSVEKPSRGPGYSTVISETGRVYGAGRMRVRINNSLELKIDEWWKLIRFNAARRTLQGGFAHHWEYNETVSSALPFSVNRRAKH